MTGKRALNRRKPCTITPCSVLCLVGIYTLMKRLGHSSIKQTEDYIKNVLDSIERKKRIKGCGLLMDIPAEKPSIYAVDANSGNKKVSISISARWKTVRWTVFGTRQNEVLRGCRALLSPAWTKKEHLNRCSFLFKTRARDGTRTPEL